MPQIFLYSIPKIKYLLVSIDSQDRDERQLKKWTREQMSGKVIENSYHNKLAEF